MSGITQSNPELGTARIKTVVRNNGKNDRNFSQIFPETPQINVREYKQPEVYKIPPQ
jgi:hypothetical protein